MRTLNELKGFAREAAKLLKRESELAAYEIYCSSSEHRVVRLNYTSDIPSRGVEEFKSLNADGFAIRVVMRRDPHETATASCGGDLSLGALRETLARARRNTITDPHFSGLPSQPRKVAAKGIGAGDLMRANDAVLAAAAWAIVGGAITRFTAKAPLKLARPGLVVGGDLSLIRDRIALASSAFDDIRTDESAYFSTSVTVLVEALEAKGTATAIGASVAELRRVANRLGADAVTQALSLRHGERPPAGVYRVVMGPQPVAEILNYMVMPSLTTGAFHASTSAYHGRFGQQVMDPRLNLFDDPQVRNAALSRRITCEGLAVRRTDLVNAGRLIGLLSNFYDANRLMADEHRAEKLGPAANGTAPEFPPLNGYRLGEAVARRFDAHPSTAGTNVIMRSQGGVSERELLGAVGDGIYIGRVWYTYPINGLRAGDFTCTISGDSHVIRNGRLAAPLAPNCFRVNANIEQIFAAPLAVGNRSAPALVWGSAETYYTPALAADSITLAAVGEG